MVDAWPLGNFVIAGRTRWAIVICADVRGKSYVNIFTSITKMKAKLKNPEKASQGLGPIIRLINIMKPESQHYHLVSSSWL